MLSSARKINVPQPTRPDLVAPMPLPRVSSRCPPSPSRFPYTTLFRSRAEASRPLIMRFILKKQRPAIAERAEVLRRKIREAAKIAGDGGALLLQDRKSTRLNSSHVRTSYAVFCSKNKRAATDSP